MYDTIIVGSGLGGLYAAHKIKKRSPDSSLLILEKSPKNGLGGRAGNAPFYGADIAIGAGIGRKRDRLLRTLMLELGFDIHEFTVKPVYSESFDPIDVKKTLQYLRKRYDGQSTTFANFARPILGDADYRRFLLSSGYTDYENAGAKETLYDYGMEDNACCLRGFSVNWHDLVRKLATQIGDKHFRFSQEVANILKCDNGFAIETKKGTTYHSRKIVVATAIEGVRAILPNPIYKQIEGQPFLRVYGKFAKSAIPLLKTKISSGHLIVSGPLQKIIAINADKGIYMIAYSDNRNVQKLRHLTENTAENREAFCRLFEKSVDLHANSLSLAAIKSFYWSTGTHYFKPLDQSKYKSREEFIRLAQNPYPGIFVVGEAVSKHQGWTEGALESVEEVIHA